MEVPLMNEVAQTGNVFAYNYTINNLFESSCNPTQWMQASAHDHGPGNKLRPLRGKRRQRHRTERATSAPLSSSPTFATGGVAGSRRRDGQHECAGA